MTIDFTGSTEADTWKAFENLRGLTIEMPSVTTPVLLEMARLAAQLINFIGEAAERDEAGPEMALEGGPSGWLLRHMVHVGDGMPVHAKVFWTIAANEMGPDYVDGFRTVGAFMKRVEGF